MPTFGPSSATFWPTVARRWPTSVNTGRHFDRIRPTLVTTAQAQANNGQHRAEFDLCKLWSDRGQTWPEPFKLSQAQTGRPSCFGYLLDNIFQVSGMTQHMSETLRCLALVHKQVVCAFALLARLPSLEASSGTSSIWRSQSLVEKFRRELFSIGLRA